MAVLLRSNDVIAFTKYFFSFRCRDGNGRNGRGAQGSVRVTSPASLLRPVTLVAEATSGHGTLVASQTRSSAGDGSATCMLSDIRTEPRQLC